MVFFLVNRDESAKAAKQKPLGVCWRATVVGRWSVGMASEGRIAHVEFEVFGKVQGVFFRKYTAKTAVGLKIRGWVMNTREGTVVGEAESTDPDAMAEFVDWLQHTGSPKSRIDSAEFVRSQVDEYGFKGFVIRR